MLTEQLRDLDNDPAREGQPGFDSVVWERLCRVRRKKIEKEMTLRTNANRLNELTAFVQVSLFYYVELPNQLTGVMQNRNANGKTSRLLLSRE